MMSSVVVKVLFLLSLIRFCFSYPVTISSEVTAFKTNNEQSGFHVDSQRYAGNNERQMQRTSRPVVRSYPLGNSKVAENGPVLTSLSASNEKSGINAATNVAVDRKPTSFSDRHELAPNRPPSRTENYNRRSEYDRNKPEDTKYLNLDSRYEEESMRSRVRTSTEPNERVSFDRSTEGVFLNSNERSGAISKRPSIRIESTTRRSTEHRIPNERFSTNRSSDRTLSNINDKSVINRPGIRTDTANIDRSGVTTKRSTEHISNNEGSGIANMNDRSGVISVRPAIRTDQLHSGHLRVTTRRSAEEINNNGRSELSLRRSGDITFPNTPDRSGVYSNKPAEPLNNDRSGVTMRTSPSRQHAINNNRSGLSVSRSIITAQTSRADANTNNPSKSHEIINYPKDSKDTNIKPVSFPDSDIQFRDTDTKWRDTVTVSHTTNQRSRTNFSDSIYFTDSTSARSSTRISISYPLTSTQKPNVNDFPDPFEALANMNESTNSTVKPFSLLDKGTCPQGSSYDPEAKKCRKDIEDY